MTNEIQTISGALIQVGTKLFPERKFNLDDPFRKSIYEQAFYILSDHKRAERWGHKPGKGLLLIGDIGVGKTMMMRTMQVYFRDSPRRFRWVNCLDFKDMLEDGLKASEIKDMYGRNYKGDLYIDDLGLGKAEWQKFGNVTNIIAELIVERDELYVSEGFRTHFSSNIPTKLYDTAPPDVKTIERMYGDRALDRIKQLTNLIEWLGKSMRG